MTQPSDRTVLFADLRGSTALFESMGSAQATPVVTQCVTAISAPVTGNRGRVIKTLGDGLMALFDTAPQAVRAAAQMQDLLEVIVSRGGAHGSSAAVRGLRLQVAIARGEVVELSGDAFGDAVNVAARLLDHAGDSETLITEEALSALNANQRGRFRSLDRLDLRGRVEPVGVHVLDGRRGGDQAVTQFADVTAPVDSPDGLRLTWIEQVQTFASAQFPVVLGRSPQAAFCVDDSRVSRSHCRVDWHGGSFQLADLSFNGTYVQFADGEVVSLRRGSCSLHGQGIIALGGLPGDPTTPGVSFEVMRFAGTRRDGRNEWLPTR